jgi:predicted transcriptional regulator
MTATESAKGKSESEIASLLHISQAQVSKDLQLINQEYLEKLHSHYEQELPKTISRALTALNELIRVNFRIIETSTDSKEIITASSLIATLLDKYVDLVSKEHLVKVSIDYITGIKEEARQIRQQYEQHNIETRYSESHPDKPEAIINPEYVGTATT